MCLDASAAGRTMRLHASRPDASTNRHASSEIRGETVYGPQGIRGAEPPPPQNDVMLVSIDGPIEERSGYHDPCGGWTDGHDAIYERLAAAFEIGDVVLTGRTPGGAVSGGPEHMRRAAEMKAKHGRRCVGHTETLVASMGLWWFAAICDEIFVSADARIGCAGARAAHMSIAGALAKEGMVPTFSAWPDEGKLAGMPELPLSAEAKARMDRDVNDAGERFAACLAASPTAMRAGLTRDGIAALGADALTGAAAVDAGLADGVATLEEVISYALATAGTGATAMAEPGEEKPEGEDAKPEEEAVCKSCKQGKLGAEQRFCGMCGADRVPAAEDDETNESAEEEEAPPSSKPKPSEDARKAIKAPAARQASTVAAMLGLRADASHPAVMAALADAMRIVDHAAKLTGHKATGEILGGMSSLAHDAAQTAATQRDLADAKRKADAAERLTLAKRGAAVDGKRDGWIADVIKGDARVGVKPGPLAAHMPIGELRGYVEGLEKRGGKRTPNPFAPDARRAAEATSAERANSAAHTAANNPAVAQATRAGVKEDEAAAIHAREFGGGAS